MSANLDKTAYRLQGIPCHWKEKQIEQALKEKYPNQKPHVKSLSCDPVIPNNRVATLSFESKPILQRPWEMLSPKLPQQGEVPVPITREGDGVTLLLDVDFEGFTPLHTTKDSDCTMDIIAITGLSGHAFGSFKRTGHSSMWLRDYLPQDFPMARIFVYGDDTKRHSIKSVSDLARTFAQRLRIIRQNASPRPWIIIGYSLGGLIAKEAINMIAKDELEHNTGTYRSLIAGFFFGVPNEGLHMDMIRYLYLQRIQPTLVRSLDPRYSHDIDRINAEYYPVVQRLVNFQTLNFYETKESPVSVSRYSATQGRPWNEPRTQVFAVDCTHHELVKFESRHNEQYQVVLSNLKKLSENQRQFASSENECLRSLAFPEMGWHAKKKPHENTCHWLRDHPVWKTWCSNRQDCLWILGPPGSGKSTLMRFAMQDMEEASKPLISAGYFVDGSASGELQKSLLGLYRSVLHQLLQHFPGHLQSLAAVFEKRQNTIGECGRAWNWETVELQDSLFRILEDESTYRTTPLFLFFDAIDELGYERARQFVESFDQFLGQHPEQELNISLCFSCRHYPALYQSGLSISMEAENREDIKTFVDVDLTLPKLGKAGQQVRELILDRANGIFSWVTFMLQKVSKMHMQRKAVESIIESIEKTTPELDALYGSILENVEKDEEKETLQLFEWMLFATRPLSLAELRQVLAIDPYGKVKSAKELHFYDIEQMEAVVNSVSKGLARVTSVETPEKRNTGHWAHVSDDRWMEDDADAKTLSDQFENISISSAEPDPRTHPAYNRNRRKVEFIHQSVADYLWRSGLKKLSRVTDAATLRAQAHYRLGETCVLYLRLKELEEWRHILQLCQLSRSDSRQNLDDSSHVPIALKYPLMSYAFWFTDFHKRMSGDVEYCGDWFQANLRAGWYDGSVWEIVGDTSDLNLYKKIVSNSGER